MNGVMKDKRMLIVYFVLNSCYGLTW